MAETGDIERAPSSSPTLAPGTLLGGRYAIERLLGEGAMGRVYAAEDRLLGTPVAVKVMRAEADGEQAAARFRREIQLARLVSHDNVCRVHDVVVDRDVEPPLVFLTMELVRGETLADRLRAGPLSCADARPLVVQMAAALDAAHRAGVIHRDFKPSNVILEQSVGAPGGVRAVVTDFGIARAITTDAAASLTGTGEVVGTPAYMAPEQAEGGRVTPATDVYALGVVLYQMVTGRLPFEGDALAIAVKRATHDPPSPRELARDLEPRWETTILRCLERDPRRRFARADEVPAALDGRVPLRRRAAPLVAGFLVLALAGGGIAFIGGRSDRPKLPASSSPRPLSVDASRRLTFDLGCEEYPSFTPDGVLVYDAPIGGDYEIVARDLETNAVRRLTHEPGWDYAASVSPDGALVAYIHFGATRELRLLPLDGSTAPAALGTIHSFPAWTADGSILAGGEDGTIFRVEQGAGGWSYRRVGAAPPGHWARYLAELPDGAIWALWRSTSATTDLSLGFLRPGEEARVVERFVTSSETFLLPSPAGDALYYARRSVAGGSELVRRRVVDGVVEVVPGGLPVRSGFALAPGADEVAYSTCASSSHLIRVDARGGPQDLTPRSEFRERSIHALDDRRLLLVSDRGGQDSLWTLDLGTRALVPFLSKPAIQSTVSPDRRLVAYVDKREHGIWIVDAAGGEPRRVTSESSDVNPDFTHDSRSLVFQRSGTDGDKIHIVSLDGGEARAISAAGAIGSAPSPTEDRIAFLVRSPEGTRIYATDSRGSPPVALAEGLPPGDYEALLLHPDGRHLLLIRGHKEIIQVPLGGGAIRTRFRTDVDSITSYAIEPGGNDLIVSVISWEGDVWLAEGSFP